MLGKGLKLATVPWFWSDQYELTLQIAGLQDEAAHTVRRDISGTAFVLFQIAPMAPRRRLRVWRGNAVARTSGLPK